LFLFELLLFVDRTPSVFALPLSLVSTAVFDETVLLLVLAGMFALASTTPSRAGLPVLVFEVELVLVAVPQPVRAAAT
jgi:hypothetical protein